MGYKASQVELSYTMARMLPEDNAYYVEYQQFKKVFGEDGSVMFIGFKDPALFQLDRFNELYDFCRKIEKIEGIKNVLSVTNSYSLERNDSLKKFELLPIFNNRPQSQKELDSLKDKVLSLKFYEGLLFNSKNQGYLIGITLEKSKLDDKGRIKVVNDVKSLVETYESEMNVKMHCSGLPYIRTIIMQMIQQELYLFIIVSLLISALIITLVFKSFQVVLTTVIIVIVSVIWSLGLISLLDYKISILLGVLPSLIIIIAIENCIFLVNKYHWEFRSYGNKIKSLSRVVSRIGFATFMTNVTTAAGFATFVFTTNKMMQEFGIVSSISIILEYVLSLVLTIIIFSFLPKPKEKHTRHLDRKSTNVLIEKINSIIVNHRKTVYVIAGIIIIVCVFGVSKMSISGKLTDDIPAENTLAKDLRFFEENSGGVMPFEIIIDTKEKKGIFNDFGQPLYDIRKLQREIAGDTSISYRFSKPMSIVEALSFANQAYHYGDPKYYKLPSKLDLKKISSYFGNTNTKSNTFNSFIDSNMQVTRVSIQVADIGTKEMNRILSVMKPKVDSIFTPDKYKVTITGSSIVNAKGTEFLIGNLRDSIIIGIFLISILIALTFSSLRMIIIAMLVNLIPLYITAAIMGFFSIPIKPSTIIIFSIALGIAIDNAILFLARYRHEIRVKKRGIHEAIQFAITESGFSMIYSSLVLVLGFSIYILSGFGGIKALGALVSITLLIALFFNILVLPSLLYSLANRGTAPSFQQPIIDVDIEEEEELEEGDDDDDENQNLIDKQKSDL